MHEPFAALVVGLLGIMKAGGAYLPLDPNYPAERLAYITADAKPRVIVTEAAFLATFDPQQVPVVQLDADWPEIAPIRRRYRPMRRSRIILCTFFTRPARPDSRRA